MRTNPGRLWCRRVLRTLSAPALLLLVTSCQSASSPSGARVPAAEGTSSTPREAATQSFYAGQTVRIVVGSPPGGAFDAVARLVARHMGRHVPGNPNIIVENMPGAADIIAVNHMYNVAKPDGLSIGLMNSATFADQLLGREGVRFDLRRMHWLGSPESGIRVGVMRKDTPYQSIPAVRSAARAPRIGHVGTASGFYQLSRLTQETLGAPINLIPGFRGQADIALAVDRGELDGMIGLSHAGLVAQLGHWLEKDLMAVVIQTGVWEPSSKSFRRHRAFPEVPTWWELAPAEKRPVIELALKPIEPLRPFFTSPDVPPDRVKSLRDALWATVQDPEYQADSKKVFGLDAEDVNPMNGPDLQRVLQEALSVPPQLVEELRRIYQ